MRLEARVLLVALAATGCKAKLGSTVSRAAKPAPATTATATETATSTEVATDTATQTSTDDGAEVVASPTPTAAFGAPPAGTLVGASGAAAFTLSGSCSDDGMTIEIGGATTATATCESGAWAATLSLADVPDGAFTLSVTGGDARAFEKDVVAPVAALDQSLGDPVDHAPLTVTVADADVIRYRYGVAHGTSCDGATLGDWREVATTIVVTFAQAGAHTLCLEGEDRAGNRQTTPTAIPLTVLGWRDVTPSSVTPRGENEVDLAWTAPAGTIARYDVYLSQDVGTEPDFAAAPHVAGVAASATSVRLSDVPAGSRGLVRVRARIVSAAPVADAAASATYWTPFGALNAASVNEVQWNVGTDGWIYSEGMFVSDRFSIFAGGFYAPGASHVFAGVPTQSLQKPLYNFLSTVIEPMDGFFFDTTDVGQIWSNGVDKVAVSTSWGGNRILLYNRLPTSPEQRKPDVILGQADFASVAINGGGTVTASGLDRPTGVCFNGTTLYVADAFNNRVLGWNGWPTTMNEPADFVLGQPDMTSRAVNRGGVAGLDTIHTEWTGGQLACEGGKLVLSDAGNNRVLIWDTAPTAAAPATRVLGQTTASGVAANAASGIDEGGLSGPNTVVMVPNGGDYALVVSDSGNYRLVQWDAMPTADGQRFDRVYGQPDRTSNTANNPTRGAGTIASAWYLSNERDVDGNLKDYFWVADAQGNNRHLRWKLNEPEAEFVFGQKDFTTMESYVVSSATPRHVTGGWVVGAHRMVTQKDPVTGVLGMCNGTCLTWNEPPTDGNVDGKPGLGAATAKVGGRLYWASSERILSQPLAGADVEAMTIAPDVSIGRKTVAGADNGAVPDTWEYKVAPRQLLAHGGALLALDGPRIAVWTTAPTASHAAISAAIGQPDVSTRAANSGGVSAKRLADVAGQMMIHGGKLWVTDTGNNRVLVWNTVPTTSDVAADLVLGQTDFTTVTAGTTLGKMSAPSGITVLNGKLIVADSTNGRLLVWDAIPTASGTPADRSYDVRNEAYDLPSWYNLDYLRPYDLTTHEGRLYVSTQDRVLVLPDLW